MFDRFGGVRGVVKPNIKALSEAIQAVVDDWDDVGAERATLQYEVEL